MEKFAEILKDIIIDKNLNDSDIAKESGVSATQIGKYKKGVIPTLDVAIRLASYFGCSLDYLFGINDERKTKYVGCNYDISNFVFRYENLLKENNITHWKFSKSCNLSESSLRRWKKGDIPSIQNLMIIAKELSSSIDYLVGRYN